MQLPKISLRPVQDSDLPTLFEYQRDPLSNQMAALPARERDAFDLHWEKIRANEKIILRVILLEEQIAGHLVSFELGEKLQVGYWLGREFWSKGIATIALQQFLELLPQRPLYAHTAKHNAGSKRVLEKNGFKIIDEGVINDERLGSIIEEYVWVLE